MVDGAEHNWVKYLFVYLFTCLFTGYVLRKGGKVELRAFYGGGRVGRGLGLKMRG